MGLVYLVQPSELKGTDRYKIGCSHNDGVGRITSGYNLTTVTFLVENVDNPFEVEKRLVHAFAQRFHQLPGSREYFSGNIIDMITCFRAILVAEFDKKKGALQVEQEAATQASEEEDLETLPVMTSRGKITPFKCHKCNKYLSSKYQLNYHIGRCNGLHPLQCPICLKFFASKQNKYEHKKNVRCKPPTETPSLPIHPSPSV